jgi:hypothetical protein
MYQSNSSRNRGVRIVYAPPAAATDTADARRPTPERRDQCLTDDFATTHTRTVCYVNVHVALACNLFNKYINICNILKVKSLAPTNPLGVVGYGPVF